VASRIHIASPLIILASIGTVGCATPFQDVSNQLRTPNARGVIFAISGAGGSEATSAALQQEVLGAGLSLNLESVDWSHGYGRFLSDQMDWEHARREGTRLAKRVSSSAVATCSISVSARRHWDPRPALVVACGWPNRISAEG
jgi:hypothetical protein